MAYKYCDWTTGSDLTGDGTAALPYKTIEKATLTLVGGDVVRVAKGPSHTTLSGTLTFVDGSASVATSVDLTGSLAINDLVGKNTDDMCWWRISNITASTITLSTVYSGASQGAVTAYKMGAHDLGTGVINTYLDRLNGRNGTSTSNRLKISGGWNLSTELQDGETFFKQTGSNQYGWGLSVDGNYIEIEKLHYARCYNGIDIADTKNGIYIHDVGGYSCGQSGILFRGRNMDCSLGGTINISQTANYAIWFYYNYYPNSFNSEANITIRSCVSGPSLSGGNQYWKHFVIKRTTTNYSLYLDDLENIRIGELSIQNGNGVSSNSGATNIIIGKYTATVISSAIGTSRETILIYHYVPTSVGSDINYQNGDDLNGRPSVVIQRYGNSNYSGRMYFRGIGVIYQDATNARTLRCLRFAPTHATAPFAWSIGNVKCMNTNLDIDLSVYIKKGGGLDGIIQMAAFVLGQKVVDWTTVAATTSYAQYTITVPSSNLVMTEYVELQVRVSGTSGYAYIDDFSVSQ